MPVYEFASIKSPAKNAEPVDILSQPTHSPGVSQTSDIVGGRKGPDISVQDHPDHVEEFLIPGFWSLDEAMKNYWSGMRVPDKDSYRLMRVKIAGGDKTVLYWRDDIDNSRVALPVCSINRLSYEFNKDKYSPAYFSMARRHVGPSLDRVARVRRPVPFLVDYEMIVWAEHKRDAEYILYQIATRFNPMVTFQMSDMHLEGCVTLLFGGHTDASDKEAKHDQAAKVRYEYRMTAEAWLPLPEVVVPTVLGKVTSYKEQLGDVLLNVIGDIPN